MGDSETSNDIQKRRFHDLIMMVISEKQKIFATRNIYTDEMLNVLKICKNALEESKKIKNIHKIFEYYIFKDRVRDLLLTIHIFKDCDFLIKNVKDKIDPEKIFKLIKDCKKLTKFLMNESETKSSDNIEK